MFSRRVLVALTLVTYGSVVNDSRSCLLVYRPFTVPVLRVSCILQQFEKTNACVALLVAPWSFQVVCVCSQQLPAFWILRNVIASSVQMTVRMGSSNERTNVLASFI